jgi:signal transduction histidine kinase
LASRADSQEGRRDAKPMSVTTAETHLADEIQRLRAALDQRTSELARSEARFRDVIERNADAIVVVDEEGIVRLVNSAAAKLLGATREQLLDTPFGFPLVTEETTELDLFRDGEARVAEMRVVESEWEGAPACIASLRDVTDRKHAEQDARELIREHAARAAAEASARRLRFLLDSSTLLASSLDSRETFSALVHLCTTDMADWAVAYCVDDSGEVRRLEGAHRDPARAALVRELKDAAIDSRGPHPVLAVLKTGKSVLVKSAGTELLELITQNDRHREIVRALGAASLMIVPIRSRNRDLGAIALVSADDGRRFTEQDLALAEDIATRAGLAVLNAQLYEEAREANKTKSDFLAVVSHDLRTPLTAIIGYVDLMEMGVPDPLPEASRERLQRIRTSATHLRYLLNELLIFARLDAGREELRLRDVDLREIARETAAVVEPLANERELQFRLDLPETSIPLRTDPDKVRQVLLNLAGNAVKYTQRGEVHVQVEMAGGGATIRVRDTGVGIAREHLTRIFEPFWQVDSSRRGRDGGTGLGLSVVRRLVQLLDGTISVESAVGVGSTFTVTLPHR